MTTKYRVNPWNKVEQSIQTRSTPQKYRGIACLWGVVPKRGCRLLNWLPDVRKFNVSQAAVCISLALNAGCAASIPRNEFPTKKYQNYIASR
jgi:hypothetical protein